MELNCGNGITEIGGKKKIVLVCGNAIAEIGGKKFVAIVAMPLPQFHSTFFFFFFWEMICAHNFYNIFTTNFKWQVVIVELKK